MELIAIVSAVALLTALLAPAVADVSRRGKDTICLPGDPDTPTGL
jgi:hypothetical protein